LGSYQSGNVPIYPSERTPRVDQPSRHIDVARPGGGDENDTFGNGDQNVDFGSLIYNPITRSASTLVSLIASVNRSYNPFTVAGGNRDEDGENSNHLLSFENRHRNNNRHTILSAVTDAGIKFMSLPHEIFSEMYQKYGKKKDEETETNFWTKFFQKEEPKSQFSQYFSSSWPYFGRKHHNPSYLDKITSSIQTWAARIGIAGEKRKDNWW